MSIFRSSPTISIHTHGEIYAEGGGGHIPGGGGGNRIHALLLIHSHPQDTAQRDIRVGCGSSVMSLFINGDIGDEFHLLMTCDNSNLCKLRVNFLVQLRHVLPQI